MDSTTRGNVELSMTLAIKRNGMRLLEVLSYGFFHGERIRTTALDGRRYMSNCAEAKKTYTNTLSSG